MVTLDVGSASGDSSPSVPPYTRHSGGIQRAESSVGSDRPDRALEPRSINVYSRLADDRPKALTVSAQLRGEFLGDRLILRPPNSTQEITWERIK